MYPPSFTEDDGNKLSVQRHYDHHDTIEQVPRAGPTSRYRTYLLGEEAPPTPEASPEPTVHNPHTLHQPPGGLLPPFDRSINPALRRQYLSSIIASCNPEELLFMSETIAPLLKRDFLYQLPMELVLHVLSFIDEPRDLVRASQVCKYWYKVVRDESIWKRMCYLHGFDDCEEAEHEFELKQAKRRREKGKKIQLDPLSDDERIIIGGDVSADEKEVEVGRGKKQHHHHHHYNRKFSFRRHFKTSFIIRTNWRTGGKLLKSHRLPIVTPDTGTVTSLALDSESVIVGFANSMIKIFSARTGVLCRTLVGHKSGVWCVCLVSKGGYRDREPGQQTSEQQSSSPSSPQLQQSYSPPIIHGSSSNPLETRQKRQKPPKHPKESQESRKHSKKPSSKDKGKASTSLSAGLSNLNLRNEDDVASPISLQSPQQASSSSSVRTPTLDLRERKGVNRIMPFQSQEHLISSSMQVILGMDPHHSEDSNKTSNSGSSSSSSSSSSEGAEDVVDVDERARHRRRRQHNKSHSHLARPHHQHDHYHCTEDQDELNHNIHRKTLDTPCSSRGWGQPNPIVVSGGCDKTVRVWDAVSGQCIYILHGHTSTIRAMRVLHNRPIAVTGSRDSTVRIWDIQLGRCLRVLEGHLLSVRCLDVHGNRAVSGSYDNTCRLWDIDTGQCLHILIGHYHQVYTVAFDGVRIASGGLDTTVRVWDAETGHCVALLQGHTALVCEIHLSPTILATGGSDGRVITFSLDTYEVLYRLVPHESSVTSLQLDDNYLVTGGNDGRVKLYETQTGTFVRELTDVSDNVWKVAFAKETCAVMCRRGPKTVVEIWSLSPKFLKRRNRDGRRGDGAITS